MKLYTYKPGSITQDYEINVGHPSAYYNKRFTLKVIHKLLIPLGEQISGIIDKANDIDQSLLAGLNGKLKSTYDGLIRSYIVNTPVSQHKELRANLVANCSPAELEEINKVQDLLTLTYNTIYEFIDGYGERRSVNIFKCGLEPFSPECMPHYYSVAKEAQEYNLKVEQEIMQHLLEMNAVEDYINFTTEEKSFYSRLSKDINKALI